MFTLAMAAIGSQSVTVRANAAEGSGHVVATESALVTYFLAFVHIFADLHGTWSESVGTIALESAFHVGTRSVAANVGALFYCSMAAAVAGKRV